MDLPILVLERASFDMSTSMLTLVVFCYRVLVRKFFLPSQMIRRIVLVRIKQREDLLGCGLCKRHSKQVKALPLPCGQCGSSKLLKDQFSSVIILKFHYIQYIQD